MLSVGGLLAHVREVRRGVWLVPGRDAVGCSRLPLVEGVCVPAPPFPRTGPVVCISFGFPLSSLIEDHPDPVVPMKISVSFGYPPPKCILTIKLVLNVISCNVGF